MDHTQNGMSAAPDKPKSRSPSLSEFISSDFALALVLALGAFLIYLRTLAPGILDGDSGEWQYMANILGVAHSTGYPLYLLLAKAFTLMPFGNPAWRVNLSSAACASVSLIFVYLLAKRVSSSRPSALAATALFAFAPTLWASAVEAEVYALNTLLLSVTLFLAVQWYDNHSPAYFYAMAVSFGLALDNHRVALFVAPAILLLVWFHRDQLTLRRLFAAGALILVPLALYLYIPLRASQLLQDQTAANWQLYPREQAILKGTVSAYYNNTPAGVFNLITGFDNRNKLGFQDNATDAISTRLFNATTLLFEQFNPIVLVAAVVGILVLFKRDRVMGLFFVIWSLGIAGVSIALRAESTRFYFSGAYLIVTLCFAVGAGVLRNWSQYRRWPALGISGLLVVLPLLALWNNFPAMDESAYTAYDRYARSVLQDNIASNAVIVAPWELATGLRYLQFVEGQRPDLIIIHESPVRPQFDKLLGSAHTLDRPFYYVQFNPEDRTIAGTRTVQAVGLPIVVKPSPHHPLDVMLTPAVRVLGYDLEPDPAAPGQLMRIMVYYQVVLPVGTRYTAGLDLIDIKGELHGNWQHSPVSEYYPTLYWRAGEYYRDVWDVSLPADAPKGLYNFQLAWYPVDPRTNTTNFDQGSIASLGPIRAGDFGAGEPPIPLRQEFANGMALLGYGLSSISSSSAEGASTADGSFEFQRGQPLKASLYWTALAPVVGAFTIFVHLEDSNGAVLAQSDRPPWDGMFPTDRWSIGEIVRDDYNLQIPETLAAGDYSIRVGLYQTPDRRVPLISGGDEGLVVKFRLTER